MINARKVAILVGGLLTATLAAGCFGPGYGGGYGYNGGGYSSYGSYPSYAGGYSYPEGYRNSYSTGYVSRGRDDENRGAVRTESRPSTVTRERSSNRDSATAHRSERN